MQFSPGEIKEIASALETQMQCNCDLDSWEPERSTGHSYVCRIHNAAKEEMQARATRGAGGRGGEDEHKY